MKTLILDTSPLVALYLGEPTAAWVLEQMNSAERHMMSAVNLAECLIFSANESQTKPIRLAAAS